MKKRLIPSLGTRLSILANVIGLLEQGIYNIDLHVELNQDFGTFLEVDVVLDLLQELYEILCKPLLFIIDRFVLIRLALIVVMIVYPLMDKIAMFFYYELNEV